MSIIPVGGRQGSNGNTPSSEIWDRLRDLPLPLDLWDPFADFTFPFSSLSPTFPEFGLESSLNTRLDWRETPNAHILRAALPGFSGEDVLVELQDDRVLQISTDSGSFMSRFKIPENAMIEQLNAFMDHGVLTVTVPKEGAGPRNVRAIEISGDE